MKSASHAFEKHGRGVHGVFLLYDEGGVLLRDLYLDVSAVWIVLVVLVFIAIFYVEVESNISVNALFAKGWIHPNGGCKVNMMGSMGN